MLKKICLIKYFNVFFYTSYKIVTNYFWKNHVYLYVYKSIQTHYTHASFIYFINDLKSKVSMLNILYNVISYFLYKI